MLVLLGVLAIGLPALSNVVMLLRLREYRTDIDVTQSMGEGRSLSWQGNVLNTANYSPAGVKLLRWYKLVLALQALGFIVGFILFDKV